MLGGAIYAGHCEPAASSLWQAAVCADKPSDDAAGRRSDTVRKLQVNAAGCKCERSREAALCGCFCSTVRLSLQVW